MKIPDYDEFHAIIEESQYAFEYAETHFEELMARPVAYVLYGPYVEYGPGAAFPSQRLTSASERVLKEKTRREKYTAYFFDSKGDVLYSKKYSHLGVTCTVLHFWIGDTKYSRYFFRERNAFYIDETFSVKYDNSKIVRCGFACPYRVYVEYLGEYNANGTILTECNWYDYRPERKVGCFGMPISKSAPFGAPDSPVMMGKEYFKPINSEIFLFRGTDT